MRLKEILQKFIPEKFRSTDTAYNDSFYEEKCFPDAEEYIREYTKITYMPKHKSEVNDKTVLKGVILGDIFGMPYEMFGLPENEDPDTVNPLIDRKSRYTDDTVMSIAVYEAAKKMTGCPGLKNDDIMKEYASSMRKWARKYPNAGYGDKFYDWAVLLIDDDRYKSYGDGGAMRSGILGAIFDSYEETVRHAILCAMPTHSHPEGVKGAVISAVSVWLALHGYSKEDILQYALRLYPSGYRKLEKMQVREYITPDITIDELIEMSPDTAFVITQVAMPEAIANFIHSDNYEGCLRNCLRYRCDSDTVGAISGGIAAAYYGNTNVYMTDTDNILKDKLSTEIKDMLFPEES